MTRLLTGTALAALFESNFTERAISRRAEQAAEELAPGGSLEVGEAAEAAAPEEAEEAAGS